MYNTDTLLEGEFMKRKDGQAHRPKTLRRFATAGLLACCLAVAASSQNFKDPTEGDRPDADFQIARIMYSTGARAGSRGISQPMWAVDYPGAEEHLRPIWAVCAISAVSLPVPVDNDAVTDWCRW